MYRDCEVAGTIGQIDQSIYSTPKPRLVPSLLLFAASAASTKLLPSTWLGTRLTKTQPAQC